MAQGGQPVEREPLRARLSGLGGKQYWRSLEELAATPAFEEFIHREFPEQASRWEDEPSRRTFLRMMAASMALAGLTGCTRAPEEKIVPYVTPPEGVVPGRPLFFATAMPHAGYGRGVLVESHLGRPTKVEGNPDHPSSLGAADAITQASVLDLWDPDRAQVVSRAGQISTWGEFLSAWNGGASDRRASGGRGLRVLTGAITSPTLLSQLKRLLDDHPQARWHHWEPVGRDHARGGARLAFGRDVNLVYRLDRAERILSLDSDFLLSEPGSLRYARDFSDRRRVRSPVDRNGRPAGAGQLAMSRLYAIQSTPTITGAAADHRLSAAAGEIEGLARSAAANLGLPAAAGPGPSRRGPRSDEQERWIRAAAEDLKQHRGSSLVVAGEWQPPAVHALAHAMNEELGNAGRTVVYTEPAELHPDGSLDSIRDLARAMRAGEVDTLLVLGPNPVLTAPADLGFTEALDRVKLRIHHALCYDETSFHCHWHIPESHYLETWSDIRGHDGTVSVMQPLIAPLYASLSSHQLLDALLGEPDRGTLAPVLDRWKASFPGKDFEALWREALRKGVIDGTALPPVEVKVERAFLSRPSGATAGSGGAAEGGEALEVIFRPDPAIGDGRFANNGWLQELPRPLTKLTWDNAALLSPATARRLDLSKEQVVRLVHRGRSVEAPVWILPGQPDGSITVHLGYGRERAGRIGNAGPASGGFNAYTLRTSEALWSGADLQVFPTGRHYPLACTQPHQMIAGPTRELVRVESIHGFDRRLEDSATGHAPGGGKDGGREHSSIHPDHDYSRGHQWAMEIDNNSCIGCNACVVACQAENNIPIVGKKEVLNSREMHWIRIDTYFDGDPGSSPAAYFEPLPCMHCEKAPCEPVCPVSATTHSAEGLNEMTYNRCVGTRYCSNNCPYKVRRFNFFDYTRREPSLALGHNPEVTVRARGVMEKCTYCVQRVNRARIEIKKLEADMSEAGTDGEKREVRLRMDAEMGGLQTACAQACPTRAITFGDLNWKFLSGEGEEASPVKRLRMQPQDYGLLTGLNTEPRTRYLPKFKNPNPDLGEA